MTRAATIARIERRLVARYRPAARRARTAAQQNRIRVRLRLDLIKAFAREGIR